MWQHASSQLALNLVPCRILARPFAPISATILHIKHLHDDTKKPDPALENEFKDSPADVKLKLEAQNSAADSESASEEAGLEALGNDVEITAPQKGGKLISDARRVARNANHQKYLDEQRAAGFPILKRLREAQRASGWAPQKKYDAEQRAIGYPNLRKSRHAKLLRDIEAANRRKLAEDPTFVPSPLPDFESMPRIAHRKYLATVPCPEPGCKQKLSNERTLALHILNKHTYSRYSIDTPHKCKDPSCNKYFPTTQKASQHSTLR